MDKDKPKTVENSSSDDESDEDGLGTVEEIMENGGRKKRTINSEAMYVKKWNDYLKSKGKVKKNLRLLFKCFK